MRMEDVDISDSDESLSTSSSLDWEIGFDRFRHLLITSQTTMLQIVAEAQDVSINSDMLRRNEINMMSYINKHAVADKLPYIAFQYLRNIQADYPTKDTPKTLNWLFVLHALNFSLWYPRSTKQWIVRGRTGYKALCSAIRRAIDEGKPIWKPHYYSKITQSELEIIFRSDDKETSIPLIEERVKVLHQIGKVLVDDYGGDFGNCIELSYQEAVKLRYILYRDFEAFRDTIKYKGEEVYIGCKAAALITDLRILMSIYGDLYWISTMFVDYCAPRVLVHLGILRYSDRLKARFAENEPLEQGSREDIELRCCSLVACKRWYYELMSYYGSCMENREIMSNLKYCIPVIIDNFLWRGRHELDKNGLLNEVPFHNVRSIYY